eukprot:scaffold153830_cov35-Tisochrysis_lutea.AAC.6
MGASTVELESFSMLGSKTCLHWLPPPRIWARLRSGLPHWSDMSLSREADVQTSLLRHRSPRPCQSALQSCRSHHARPAGIPRPNRSH